MSNQRDVAWEEYKAKHGAECNSTDKMVLAIETFDFAWAAAVQAFREAIRNEARIVLLDRETVLHLLKMSVPMDSGERRLSGLAKFNGRSSCAE